MIPRLRAREGRRRNLCAGTTKKDHIQELRDRVTAALSGQSASTLSQYYDGAGLRVKKTENGATTWYLRSSVLGGQVVAEMNGSAAWQRGFVYAGSSLMAVQQGGVFWMHEDPVTKSKRVTNSAGTVVSWIETDPWGADTNRSSNAAFQPKKFTSYDRDANGSDEAMFRRFNRKHSRFDQPDPYGGSYSLTNPQSFNRYAYVQNDPVNFVDPSGLCPEGTTSVIDPETGKEECVSNYNETVTVTVGWDDMSDYLPSLTLNNDLFLLVLPEIEPQDPKKILPEIGGPIDVTDTIRKGIGNRRREDDAWNEYIDCINNNPGHQAWEERLRKTRMKPPTGPARSLVSVGIRAAWTGVVTTTAAAGSVFSFLWWGMTMDAEHSNEYRRGFEKMRQLYKDCFRSAEQKHGITPRSPAVRARGH